MDTLEKTKEAITRTISWLCKEPLKGLNEKERTRFVNIAETLLLDGSAGREEVILYFDDEPEGLLATILEKADIEWQKHSFKPGMRITFRPKSGTMNLEPDKTLPTIIQNPA